MSALLDDGGVWAGEGKRPVRSLAEFARNEIEQRIQAGVFLPGEKLEEVAIARLLGISRTPVREALRQLHAAQLVDQEPNKRPVVVQLNYSELAKLFETAAEIEALCARFSARRIGELGRRQLKLIDADFLRAVQLGHADQCKRLAELFHEAIWRGAHNVSLAEVARNVRVRLSPYHRLCFLTQQDREDVHRAQTAILEVVAKGDEDGAWSLMREHINHLGFCVLEQVFGAVVTHERLYDEPSR